MKRIPLLYKTDELDKELILSTRTDKLGSISYCVEFVTDSPSTGCDYAFFKKLESALDFINSNFK